MKKILLFAVMLMAAACSQHETNPVEEAIATRLGEVTPGIKEVYFQKLELMDSVTLSDEISYREKLFNLKCEVLEKKYNKFKAERKPKNAALILQDLEKARRIKESIGGLREALADSLDVVKYYEYRFSAVASTENNEIQITDYYAYITPDMKVLKYAQDKKGMRNGIGYIIPGYNQILENAGVEE